MDNVNKEFKNHKILFDVFSEMFKPLSTTSDPECAAKTIAEAADKIIGWDSCGIIHYSEKTGIINYLYLADTVNNHKTEFFNNYVGKEISPTILKVLSGEKVLISRDKNLETEGLTPFGDKNRLSASLLFVPMRRNKEVVGVLSIQSYTHNKYTYDDLDTLQFLGDLFGGFLDRIHLANELNTIHNIYYEAIENAGGIPYRFNHEDQHYEFMGDACLKVFEIPADKLTYQMIKSFIKEIIITDPDAPADFKKYRDAILSGELNKYMADLRIRVPSGEEKWISDCSICIRDEKTGRITYSIGIIQDISLRKKNEKEIRTISEIGRKLSEATNLKKAAEIILKAADQILGWDCAFLDLYNPSENTVYCVLSYDSLDNVKVEFTNKKIRKVESQIILDVLAGEPMLMLRNTDEIIDVDEAPPTFGNKSRRSASLIYVPMRNSAGNSIGIMSIQSYKFNNYNKHDLAMLQILADHCVGAIERIRGQEKLDQIHKIYQKTIETAGGVPYQLNYQKQGYDFVGLGCKELLGALPEELNFDYMSVLVKEVVIRDSEYDGDRKSYEQKFFRGEVKQFKADYRIITKDGKEKWINDCSIPIKDEETGEVTGSLGILQDITEHKREEQESESLRILAKRLTAPNTLKEIAVILAEESRKLFRHDSFFFSYFDRNLNKIIGVYTEDTPFGYEKPVEQEAISISFEQYKFNRTYQGLSTLINRKGGENVEEFIPAGCTERRSMSMMYAPIIWADKVFGDISAQSYEKNKYNEQNLSLLETFASHASGSVARVLAEEERRIIEEKMLHTQKLESLGILAGGIAHDFNNLLMGILGNADLAMMDLNPASSAIPNLQEIEKASRRAADLCKQLLAYSGKGRFVLKYLKIDDVVKEITHLLEITINKGIVLKYDFEENIPTIEADPTQIRQVIMNLITNASEAIGEKSGTIRIKVASFNCDKEYLENTYLNDDLKPGNYVYLEVSDTGCGMTTEIKEKIFDPFFTTKFTGRGLGLAAVLGIVKGHKGAIKIYSEKSVGSTFKLLFPAVEKPADIEKTVKDITKEWRGEGTILIIDDEEAVRKIASQMLIKYGFDTILAKDGVEGIELYKNNMSDTKLILLDLIMPHKGGEECFEDIMKINPDAKVIIISGYNEKEVMSKFTGKNSSGFLQKPFRSNELIRAIKKALLSAI